MKFCKNPSNWYVLYTAPRAEKKVEARLKEKSVECWLPIHKSPRQWSDRIKIVDIPLFSSYIFVHTTQALLSTLPFQIYGVTKIVYHNGKPAIMRQQDLESIAEFLKEAENQEITIGQEVEVLVGPMKNVSGIIQRMEKNKIQLFIEQLGVMLTVHAQHVAPLNHL